VGRKLCSLRNKRIPNWKGSTSSMHSNSHYLLESQDNVADLCRGNWRIQVHVQPTVRQTKTKTPYLYPSVWTSPRRHTTIQHLRVNFAQTAHNNSAPTCELRTNGTTIQHLRVNFAQTAHNNSAPTCQLRPDGTQFSTYVWTSPRRHTTIQHLRVNFAQTAHNNSANTPQRTLRPRYKAKPINDVHGYNAVNMWWV
jgi:hypothetical protein